MHPARRLRAPVGITLLEVLVSIGILAVGLTSVLSLIPLGRSLISKTVVLDQSDSLLENARAAVLTLGMANVDALTDALATSGTGPCPAAPIIIDPLGIAAGAWPAATGLNPAVLHAGATLTGTTAASTAPRGWPVSGMLFSSADDVLVTTANDDDSPVTNLFSQGVRKTAGRTTWLAVLAKSSGTTPFVAGEIATLSIVVSRNRVPGLMPPPRGTATTPVSLVVTSSGPPYRLSWPAAAQLFPDRENREVIRKGAILLTGTFGGTDGYRPPKFLTLSTATLLPDADGAEVTFAGSPSFPTSNLPVWILPDATAVREFTATIEGFSEFTR